MYCKGIKKIEKKYKLSNIISNYYINQWLTYINNDVICYLNVPKNIRTVNSIEIFNRYFHKKCNGKGLVTVYELLDSIKDEFKEKEFKLFNLEKNLASESIISYF